MRGYKSMKIRSATTVQYFSNGKTPIRFRILGGRFDLRIDGATGAELSVVGRGRAMLDGAGFDELGLSDGEYSLNDSPYVTVPSIRTLGDGQGAAAHSAAAQAALTTRSGMLDAAMTNGADKTVLVVEDEESIASFVALYLRNAGYGVETAATGADAMAKLESARPSLVVLDLMLPDADGIDVCRRMRKGSDVPILMLTARDEDVDKIIGLEVGADDYMTKPFNPRELVARVKSILRRANADRRPAESRTLAYGELHIDAGRREVRVGEEEIQLAPKEFDLLWELLDHRGIVLTRDQLLERVWGYTFAGDTRTVDVHVRQLRRKLGDASPIVTVWGVGYKVAHGKVGASVTDGSSG